MRNQRSAIEVAIRVLFLGHPEPSRDPKGRAQRRRAVQILRLFEFLGFEETEDSR